MNKEKFIFACFFALSLALFLAPVPPSPFEGRGLDKLVHAVIFAGLLTSGYLAFPLSRRSLLFLLILYGPAVELLQLFLFTYRSFDYRDMLFDWLGLFLGFAAWNVFKI